MEVIVENVWTYLKQNNLDHELLREIETEMSYTVQEYVRHRKTYVDFDFSLLDRDKLRYPTGLFSNLYSILSKHNLSYDLIDLRKKPSNSSKLEVHGKKFRDYQSDTVEKALETERGVIKIATGGGKTVIGAGIIADLNIKTMFIVNSLDLLEQAYDEFTKMLQCDIGKVGGGECDIHQINVCTIQTLHSALDLKYEAADDECFIKERVSKKILERKEEIRGLIESTELIIMDECFHYDTYVLVDIDKQVKIGEIVDNPFITHVVSYNHEKNIYEKKKIVRKWKTPRTEKWQIVTVKTGKDIVKLRCTPTHKFWTKDRGYVQAKDLKENDVLKHNDSKPKTTKICNICGYEGGKNLNGHILKHENRTPFSRKEVIEKRSKNEKWRQKFSDKMKGEKNIGCRLEVREKITASWKENWERKSEEEKTKVRKNWINAPKRSRGKEWKPTSLEQRIIDLDIPELAYTGDGKFWISIGKKENNKNWSKNPDFKVRGQKKVIEAGNITYWHSLGEIQKVVKGFESKGYQCLYLTNEDIEDNWEETKGKIFKFVYNHDEATVISSKFGYSSTNQSVKGFRYNLEVEDNHNYFANNILVSNCQHSKANSYVNMMKAAKNSYFKFGLSATPYKYESSDIILNAYSGKEIVSIDASYLIDRGFLVAPKIYVLDPNLLSGYKFIRGKKFQTIYKEWIVENKKRNEMIVDCAERMMELDKTTLITVSRIPHGENIMELLEKRLKGVKSAFIRGEVKKKDRKDLLNSIRKRDLKILVGTSVADEGLDIPALDSAIIGGGGKSLIKSLQRVGRTLRPYPNAEENIKKEAIVVDFFDHLRYLTGHAKKRIKIYKRESRFEIFEHF